MSAEFRRKLVNWLTSMLVLLTVVIGTSLYGWFSRYRYWVHSDQLDDTGLIWALTAPFEGYAAYFILLYFWHSADFVERESWTNRWLKRLADYRLMVSLLLLIGASTLFHQSDWLNDLGCPQVTNPPGTYTFDGCGSWAPWWKGMISLSALLALVGVVFAKVVLVLASYVTALRKKALSYLKAGD